MRNIINNTNNNLEFPDTLYAEYDPTVRYSILNEHPDTDREHILNVRYSISKNSQYVDNFMKAFMLMKISADNGVTFFNKKKLIKEWRDYASLLMIDTYSKSNDQLKALIESEWYAFISQYILSCLNDKVYGSTLFGIMQMKDEALINKLVNELALLTRGFPDKLGLKDTFSVFANCVQTVLDHYGLSAQE